VVEKTEDTAEAVKNPRNAAYALAAKRLRQAHSGEFRDLYRDACDQFGIAYVERMSAAERAEADRIVAEKKAAQTIADLVAQYGVGILGPLSEATVVDLTGEDTETF
jgi:hypothetical protein